MEITHETHDELAERATLSLGRLDGFAISLPEPKQTLALFVVKEAALSAQVEGSTVRTTEVLQFLDEGEGSDAVRAVADHAAALSEGLSRLRGGHTLSAALVRQLYARMRPNGGAVGDLDPLEQLLRAGGPILPRAASAIALVERSRPFPDANGAMARLMAPLLLYGEGALHLPLLYPSLFFRSHRDGYKLRLRTDATWAQYFHEAVATTAEHAVVALRSMLALFATDRDSAAPFGPEALRVHDAFCRHPRARLARIAVASRLADDQLATGIAALEQQRIVREVEPGVFAYSAWVDLLDEGTVVRAQGPGRR